MVVPQGSGIVANCGYVQQTLVIFPCHSVSQASRPSMPMALGPVQDWANGSIGSLHLVSLWPTRSALLMTYPDFGSIELRLPAGSDRGNDNPAIMTASVLAMHRLQHTEHLTAPQAVLAVALKQMCKPLYSGAGPQVTVPARSGNAQTTHDHSRCLFGMVAAGTRERSKSSLHSNSSRDSEK